MSNPAPSRTTENSGSKAAARSPKAAEVNVAPAAGAAVDPDGTVAEEAEEEVPRAPWHFKILLFGTAGYLIYRLVWFIFWLTGHAWHG